MLPAAVLRFRQEHRTTIPPGYSGLLHFFIVSFCTSGAMAFCLYHLHRVRPGQWLTVPLAFLFANFVEYRAHRGPMHHPPRSPQNPLRLIYLRHAGQHHRFYTHDAMAAESTRDFQMVLFPKVMLVFFIGLQLLPAGLLLWALLSANVAWLFAATGLGYFLLYEWLHLCYHLPEDLPGLAIGRLPFVNALKRHHQIHHDQRQMNRCNFNITFPVFDAFYRTRASDQKHD